MAPTHRVLIHNTDMLPSRPILVSVDMTSLPQQAEALISFATFKTFLRSQHTCFVLHFHPFFSSCGHLSAKVARLASTMRSLPGYSFKSSSLRAWIETIIAQPQSEESFKCSSTGLSSSSHPTMDFSQRKQVTLSFCWLEGLK